MLTAKGASAAAEGTDHAKSQAQASPSRAARGRRKLLGVLPPGGMNHDGQCELQIGVSPFCGAFDAEKRDETNDVAKEIWTALLCANIHQQAYKLGLGEQETAPSEALGRGSDGKLTFNAPEFDTLDVAQAVNETVEGAGSSSKAENHISFEMEAGRLGTIQLRVVRQGTAVSVLVGVIDPMDSVRWWSSRLGV